MDIISSTYPVLSGLYMEDSEGEGSIHMLDQRALVYYTLMNSIEPWKIDSIRSNTESISHYNIAGNILLSGAYLQENVLGITLATSQFSDRTNLLQNILSMSDQAHIYFSNSELHNEGIGDKRSLMYRLGNSGIIVTDKIVELGIRNIDDVIGGCSILTDKPLSKIVDLAVILSHLKVLSMAPELLSALPTAPLNDIKLGLHLWDYPVKLFSKIFGSRLLNLETRQIIPTDTEALLGGNSNTDALWKEYNNVRTTISIRTYSFSYESDVYNFKNTMINNFNRVTIERGIIENINNALDFICSSRKVLLFSVY